MPKLVLCRHGQSEWNQQNRFTGWWDVDLTEKGLAEAKSAGQKIHDAGLQFDVAYTSVLKRAIRTLWHILEENQQMWLPYQCHWRLNERHYGALTGLDKAETAAKHGEEQVHIWRRSYATPPPVLEKGSEYDLSQDPRYRDLKEGELPSSECLKDTLERVLPYYHETIGPSIKAGKNIIISAHGNSIRALMKHLSAISDEEIMKLEVPTGSPILYQVSGGQVAADYQFL